jgi:hypothetical protein
MPAKPGVQIAAATGSHGAACWTNAFATFLPPSTSRAGREDDPQRNRES